MPLRGRIDHYVDKQHVLDVIVCLHYSDVPVSEWVLSLDENLKRVSLCRHFLSIILPVWWTFYGFITVTDYPIPGNVIVSSIHWLFFRGQTIRIEPAAFCVSQEEHCPFISCASVKLFAKTIFKFVNTNKILVKVVVYKVFSKICPIHLLNYFDSGVRVVVNGWGLKHDDGCDGDDSSHALNLHGQSATTNAVVINASAPRTQETSMIVITFFFVSIATTEWWQACNVMS